MLLFLFLGGGLVAASGALCVVAADKLRGLYTYKYQVPMLVLRLAGTVLLVNTQYVLRGCKPRFPEWTFAGEMEQHIVRCISTHYMDSVIRPENAAYLRNAMNTAVQQARDATARKADVSLQSFTHNGLDHLWLRARDAADATWSKKDRFVMMYIHGGGFVIFSPDAYVPMTAYMQHRMREQLAQKLGRDVCVEVLLPNYRKLPQAPYPIPPEDCYAMYKYLLDVEKLSPSQIIIAGDSAGGALAMTTLLRARDEGPAFVPAAGILSCPFVDRSHKGNDRDTPYCLLTSQSTGAFFNAYFPVKEGDDPSTWGDASPVHCDLRGLPPAYIQAMEFDHLLPHAKKLYAKAKADGLTTWSIEIERNVPHAFTSAPMENWPTAAQSLDKMSAFAANQFIRAAK